MSNIVLSVKDLSVTYKNRHKEVYAVKNASFDIENGDALGIVGESGSGKSTLAMALLRLLPPHVGIATGRADFLGKDLINLPEEDLHTIRWKELAVVFQKAMNSFSPVHKLSDQISDIYRIHHPKATKKEVYDRAMDLFRLVNLSERVYNLYPHELSGGMLQRVSIAVSLIHNPKLLILDEATTALDVVTQGQILEEIRRMEQTLNMTRIMITHDMSVVASSCNKVAVMYAGDLVEVGPVSKVLTTPSHPYTAGLLSSFPSLKGENAKLMAIPGNIPDLSKHYDRCIFAERCPKCTDQCKQTRPEMVTVEPGWISRCIFSGIAKEV